MIKAIIPKNKKIIVKLSKGIPGNPGRQGNDGKSAYQFWIEAGNEGTEADFLASLKGADGLFNETLASELSHCVDLAHGHDNKTFLDKINQSLKNTDEVTFKKLIVGDTLNNITIEQIVPECEGGQDSGSGSYPVPCITEKISLIRSKIGGETGFVGFENFIGLIPANSEEGGDYSGIIFAKRDLSSLDNTLMLFGGYYTPDDDPTTEYKVLALRTDMVQILSKTPNFSLAIVDENGDIINCANFSFIEEETGNVRLICNNRFGSLDFKIGSLQTGMVKNTDGHIEKATDGTDYVSPSLLSTTLASYATTTQVSLHTSNEDNPHETTAGQVGAYTVEETNNLLNAKADSTTLSSYATTTALTAHTTSTTNPHSVTAHQAGAGFMIPVQTGNSSLSFVKNTTYYYGGLYQASLATGGGTRKKYPSAIGSITTFNGTFSCTAGSNNACSLYIRVNNTTDYLISNSLDFSSAVQNINVAGLNIPFNAVSDYFEYKLVTGNWASAPTSNIFELDAYFAF